MLILAPMANGCVRPHRPRPLPPPPSPPPTCTHAACPGGGSGGGGSTDPECAAQSGTCIDETASD